MANNQLRGTGDIDPALVQQYVNFADNEILPASCTWTFPTLGIMQYNKQVSSDCSELEDHMTTLNQRIMYFYYYIIQATEQAQGTVKAALGLLNEALATRTFLVGERVTLADITCVCNLVLLYKQVRYTLYIVVKFRYTMIPFST